MKRISFNDYDAFHIYELMLEHFCGSCVECERLKNRLEKFIGKKAVKAAIKIIKKNGYCNKLKKRPGVVSRRKTGKNKA